LARDAPANGYAAGIVIGIEQLYDGFDVPHFVGKA
jgi:hypothetical protein